MSSEDASKVQSHQPNTDTQKIMWHQFPDLLALSGNAQECFIKLLDPGPNNSKNYHFFLVQRHVFDRNIHEYHNQINSFYKLLRDKQRNAGYNLSFLVKLIKKHASNNSPFSVPVFLLHL